MIPHPTVVLPADEIASSIEQSHTAPQCVIGSQLAIGSVIDDFRIDYLLGQGGMGLVYCAWDLINDRPAALKMLGGAVRDSKLLDRFLREAGLIAKLHHPGIVELYQIGQTATYCYLVMELVQGVTLREWMADPSQRRSTPPTPKSDLICTIKLDQPEMLKLPDPGDEQSCLATSLKNAPKDPETIQKIAKMLRELADALAHAHEHEVTHRDLKPENVMLREDGRIVVIDFGLARVYADTTLTTQSGLIGTPMYMAPEQLKGRQAEPVSDIYTMGLIGYELLTHTLPYTARSVEILMGEVLNKAAPPMIERNPNVPEALANILHKAMAKDPQQRYRNAAELRDDLDRYLAGKRVRARRYRYTFSARNLIAERPALVTGTATYTLAIAGLVLVATAMMALTRPLQAWQPCLLGVVLVILGCRLIRGKLYSQWCCALALGISGFCAGFFALRQPDAGVWYGQYVLASLFGVQMLLYLLVLWLPSCRAWLEDMSAAWSEFRSARQIPSAP